MNRRALVIMVPVGVLIVTFLIFLGLHFLTPNHAKPKAAGQPAASAAAHKP